MAIRKETIRQQAYEMAARAIQPGDQIMTGVYAISGPSPWLTSQLGALGQMLSGYYFVVITQQQMILMKMGRVANRPKEISFAVPLRDVQITDFKRNTVYSSFKYGTPAMAKPMRLNVHRLWRQELDALAGAFGVPAAA